MEKVGAPTDYANPAVVWTLVSLVGVLLLVGVLVTIFFDLAKSNPLVIKVHAEWLRIIANVGFLVMFFTGQFLTNRFPPAAEVDMDTTPLMIWYGYNNPCVYLDFTPSRQVAAMLEPFWEVFLVSYMVFDHINLTVDRINDRVPAWIIRFAKVTLPLRLIAVLWFRMVFVFDGKTVAGMPWHTAPFLMLQIAIMIQTLLNTLYWFNLTPLYSRVSKPAVALTALLILVFILLKFTHTIAVIFQGPGSFGLIGQDAAEFVDLAFPFVFIFFPTIAAGLQILLTPGLELTINHTSPRTVHSACDAAIADPEMNSIC